MKPFIIGFLLCISSGVYAAENTYSFGIVPQQAAGKLARLWTPIFEYLGRESGIKIQFKTAPNIPIFEQRLALGEYDFAYMNPYHFTVFNEDPGYQALARARDKRIKGIMVVRKDSELQSLDELDNMSLAFPAPAAFAASVLPRSELSARGKNIQPKYVSSHDSVYRTVAKGLYPAGGGVIRTFKNMDPDIREQLRILWTSEGYTPHAIAAHPRVPAAVSERLVSALIAMAQSPEGQQLLESIKIKGFDAAHNEDWDDVRSLNIHLLNNQEEQ
jgi:phosphonate transport system substrate-binding protein